MGRKVEFIPATAEARRFGKVHRVLERYYSIASLDDLRSMRVAIFDPQKDLNQRKKAFAEHKKTILALQPLFKKFVLENNKVAKKDGYKNRIELMNERSGVPKERFELFLEKIDQVIETLNQKFPKIPSEATDWYWSEYNTLDAPCLAAGKRYTVPGDILDMIKKKAPEAAAVLSKVEIKEQTELNPSARYDKKKKKVVISIHALPVKVSICGAFDFVHEIAHAVVMLDYAKKGIDTSSKNEYWHEKRAYETESKLVKKLFSGKIYEAWLADFLSGFVSTLFEYEVYTNPDQDFDRVYAELHNRCYLKANQRKNPFYVLHPYFTFRPCCATASNVAITELLLEKKI